MGWNDHMVIAQARCLECGEVDDWEFWDDVGIARYSGSMGEFLGVDTTRSSKCPNCGSTQGKLIEDEDDYPE